MQPVAIYVRSSKDLHNVSCDAQEEQIREVVKKNGERVYRVFKDQALSSTRDVRPDFDEMLGQAMSKAKPFTKIYCLDTSRFGRDQHETQAFLWTLRQKHGVEVVFINMPNTGTYLDPVFETIMSAFDQLHSQQSKVKGVASQKQNVRNGYRAGGSAPYGYVLVKEELGKHRSGHTITKSRLAPDPETAPIIQEYFERRARGEYRRTILDDFFRRGISSPTGRREWPVSTGKAIEDNLEVYLGHTVFGRHNERIKERGKAAGYLHGRKWRPREEWVVKENTHEPLISEEIAEKIREMKTRGIRETPYNKKVYTLTGVLKCAECGTNYCGDRGVYRCNSGKKPDRCPNNNISQKTAEEAVFSVIDQQVLNFRNIQEVVEKVKRRFDSDQSEIQVLEKRLAGLNRTIKRVMKLYRLETIDADEVEQELVELQEQKRSINEQLDEARSLQASVGISDEAVLEAIDKFREYVFSADPEIKKRAVQTLFDEIRIHPKEGTPWSRYIEFKGVQLPLTRVNLASPRGFEPLSPA